MPAETPKAAPMGPLFAYVVSWVFSGGVAGGLFGGFRADFQGERLSYILRRAAGVMWPSLALGME
jgi:hypothetical protein